MKIFYTSIVFLLILSAAGCKNDDPEFANKKAELKEKLVGKWTFTRFSRTRYFNNSTESETGDLKLNAGDYIEFRENDSVTFVTFSKTLNGTYQILSANEFALKTSIGTSRSTIVKLDAKELIFDDRIVDDGQTGSLSTYYAAK